jgi:predicted nuclease of restriction endonuclease-like (RecB) superfamily
MLYERTAISKKPEELIRHEVDALRQEDQLTPDLVFKDPYLLDFLGLRDRYLEKDLEDAILRELERFLLELGAGFSFIARQKRIQVDSDDYYIDLLFFNRKLKRLLAIELKLGDFKLADKGQMELYLRWLDNRRGYFWGDRFKSVIMENGATLINCLAYIDLNPLRAGLAERPEQYRWNSIGYHIQTNNQDNFLSTDFGLKEFNVKSKKERIRRYRRYVYEAGSLNQPEKGKAKVIKEKVLEKERSKEFELSRSDRFRYRTRYFTDSGIIDSKEFVSSHYRRFKGLFMSKNEKIPRPVAGLDGIFSLKRLI